MDDGEMGSLRLLIPDVPTAPQSRLRLAAELLFQDSDGVDVLASLYLTDNDIPYELGVWKVDFTSVRKIPSDLPLARGVNPMLIPDADPPAETPGVWVFSGGGKFPSGVFSTIEKAEAWIAGHSLSGVLTWYPLDAGIYDWIVASDIWQPYRDDQRTPEFIGSFSSAYRHHHYESGVRKA